MGYMNPKTISWQCSQVGGWHKYLIYDRAFSQDCPVLAHWLADREVVLMGDVENQGHAELVRGKQIVCHRILSDSHDCRRTIIPGSELPKLAFAWDIHFIGCPADREDSELLSPDDLTFDSILDNEPEKLAEFLDDIGSDFFYQNDDACYTSLLLRDPSLAGWMVRDRLEEYYRPKRKDEGLPLTDKHLEEILARGSGGCLMTGREIALDGDAVNFTLWPWCDGDEEAQEAVPGEIRGDDIHFGQPEIRPAPFSQRWNYYAFPSVFFLILGCMVLVFGLYLLIGYLL